MEKIDFLRIWVSIFGLYGIICFTGVNGDIEPVLQRCCAVGSSWGLNHTTCTGPSSPLPGLTVEDRPICYTTIYICCIREHRKVNCEKGKESAYRGQICSLLPTAGGETYKDCCDACSLGLKAGSMRMPCTFSSFAFGFPWDEAFVECCKSTGVDEGTSPFGGRKDRCKTNNPCSQKCYDNGDRIQCSCHSGFRLALDQHSCDDIDECNGGSHTCNVLSETCINTVGSFQCVAKNNPTPTRQSPYIGQCPEGFSKNSETQTCDDVNECESDVCSTSEVCSNTVGSYICYPRNPARNCPPGFKQHPTISRCIDIDECAEAIDDCDRVNELCLNSHGGYQCQPKSNKGKDCPAGFKWSSTLAICEDVDECLEDLDNCEPMHEECRNTMGGYECDPLCSAGFRFDAETEKCIDVNECVESLHNCKPGELCMNTESAFVCLPSVTAACPPGYKPAPALDGAPPSCVDVDECKEELHSCDSENQKCVNAIGSYECAPNEGQQESVSCLPGFKYDFNEQRCVDINECSEKLDTCNRTSEICVNTNGSYTCELSQQAALCPPGFRMNNDIQNCEDINECLEGRHKCLEGKEECVNAIGGYKCEPVLPICPVGYRFNYTIRTCDDIDECAESKHNCNLELAVCVNVIGGFRCEPKSLCNPGFAFNVNTKSCVDVDECVEGIHSCNRETQICINAVGSYRCAPKILECSHGYKRNIIENRCEDINECVEGTDGCDKNHEYCVNTLGSYQCHTNALPTQKCGTGFVFDVDSRICKDINECEDGTHVCSQETEECVNTEGSFICLPFATVLPFQTTYSTTVNISKSRLSTRPTVSPLRCRPGFNYSQTSHSCVDINECEGIRPCALDQICENTLGSYRCICQQGYTLDPVTKVCRDVNECQLSLHSCAHSQRCDNTIGSYSCVRTTSCGTGYTLNAESGYCEDDDECELRTHNCGPGFVCRNTLGSFRCDRVRCPAGQKLLSDGSCQVVVCARGLEPDRSGNCIDVNECAIGNVCRQNQRCANTVGSYICQNLLNCGAGYELNDYGNTCVDVDECARRIDECGPQQTCRNRPGTYVCECPAGYTATANKQCEDIDECSRYQRQVCSINSECQNTQGSYTCICKEGFRKAEGTRNCIDIDECADSPNICQQNCINVWGSYQCSCRKGFTLGSDGRSCQDIDECTIYEGRGSLCIGYCVNEPGSYSCSCPEGYRLAADERTCQDIDECQEQNVCKGENEVCLNTRGSFKCNIISCPPNYIRDREHRNRCKRSSLECRQDDAECLKDPLSFSYNYITFVSNMRIPPSGQLDLFTMRGPRFTITSVQFNLDLKSARAPEGTTPVTPEYFHLRRTAYNEAMVSLVKTIPGPQEVELELIMKMYHNGLFGGTAVAKIFIFVTRHEF